MVLRENRPVKDVMSSMYHFYSDEHSAKKGIEELSRWNIQKNPVNYEIREMEIEINERETVRT